MERDYEGGEYNMLNDDCDNLDNLNAFSIEQTDQPYRRQAFILKYGFLLIFLSPLINLASYNKQFKQITQVTNSERDKYSKINLSVLFIVFVLIHLLVGNDFWRNLLKIICIVYIMLNLLFYFDVRLGDLQKGKYIQNYLNRRNKRTDN